MKIAVSSKNEFRFVPDIADNLDKPENEQFVIIMKKLSQLQAGEWSTISGNNEVNYDMRKKLNKAIVRIENAPILEIDEKDQIELTKDILLSGQYPELMDLELMLVAEMVRIENEASINVKKF